MPLRAALRRNVIGHLARGGVIAYATESCYGFGCNPMHRRAVQSILRLKRRPQMKGMIVIGASAQQLRRFMALLNAQEHERMLSRWPGPHTWLVPAARKAPHWITGGRSKIALRVPGHKEARELCARVRSPLVSTSANRSGEVPIKTYRECIRRFGSKVLALRGKIGKRKQPSRIEDLRSGNIVR